MYDQIDSYRAMIDREGAADSENIAFFGDEAERRRKIQRLRDIGVSDLNLAIPGVGEHDTRTSFPTSVL
ncbi:MAG: hypothetical protein KUG60_00525 [Gammaproteobacteria bacterium]|nr:hypothetical protein [Gammaproteobacteria bacterium]